MKSLSWFWRNCIRLKREAIHTALRFLILIKPMHAGIRCGKATALVVCLSYSTIIVLITEVERSSIWMTRLGSGIAYLGRLCSSCWLQYFGNDRRSLIKKQFDGSFNLAANKEHQQVATGGSEELHCTRNPFLLHTTVVGKDYVPTTKNLKQCWRNYNIILLDELYALNVYFH
jgi:hypothetical protein